MNYKGQGHMSLTCLRTCSYRCHNSSQQDQNQSVELRSIEARLSSSLDVHIVQKKRRTLCISVSYHLEGLETGFWRECIYSSSGVGLVI